MDDEGLGMTASAGPIPIPKYSGDCLPMSIEDGGGFCGATAAKCESSNEGQENFISPLAFPLLREDPE